MLSPYKKRMNKLREAFGGKCVKCGATEDLHFDHIDPKTKVAAVGELAVRKGFDYCYQEALKCQLLCKSCHKKKTIENGEQIARAKHHILTFKSGQQVKVYSLDTWCRENNFHEGHIRAIRRGERKSHKGIVKVETL
jgi:5-methylcytosine-specific restriction endonuclease McrA